MPLLTLTTSTRSLSPISSTSPTFPTVSPRVLYCEFHNCGTKCKKIPARTLVVSLARICTQNTHPWRASRTLQSSHKHEHEMRACGSRCLSCSIFVRMRTVSHPVSHVISCWSLPYLLSSSPQHEAPPGPHDLLQDDTVHRAHFPKPTRSESNTEEPLSHVNYESGGNLRTNTPTQHTVCSLP